MVFENMRQIFYVVCVFEETFSNFRELYYLSLYLFQFLIHITFWFLFNFVSSETLPQSDTKLLSHPKGFMVEGEDIYNYALVSSLMCCSCKVHALSIFSNCSSWRNWSIFLENFIHIRPFYDREGLFGGFRVLETTRWV